MDNTAIIEKAKRLQQEHDKIILVFSRPVRVNTSRRETKEVTIYTTRIFTSSNKRLCYTTMRSRNTGYPLSDEMMSALEDVKEPGQKDYAKNWKAIAKSMRKYNINLDIADCIDKHLRGEEPHIRGFQNYWTIKDKPKLMSFADVTRGRSIEEMKKLATKSEYGDYLYFRASIDGQRRDRSIGLQEKSDHSGWKFYAASEFSGCGNGDYYMMYSPTMAFYAESD